MEWNEGPDWPWGSLLVIVYVLLLFMCCCCLCVVVVVVVVVVGVFLSAQLSGVDGLQHYGAVSAA